MTIKNDQRITLRNIGNKNIIVANTGTEITFHAGAGTNDATNVYFDLKDKKGSSKSISILVIRTSATCEITKWNGDSILPDPISVSTAGFKDEHLEISSVSINTQADNTQLFVTAK